MKQLLTTLTACLLLGFGATAQERFPDGTPIPEWFSKNTPTDIGKLGKAYRITEHGVLNDSSVLQTEKIQAVIDLAAKNGGGVVVVPKGTFLTASLFFKPKTHLHLEEGAMLKGSDDIGDFPVVMTRIEGQTLKYFPALVNADSVDGFTLSGKGTLNGNGLRYWKSFWQRRRVIPKCTNMDELRPRLLWLPNPGQSPQPLDRIASGGELSRFLLAVTGLAATNEQATLVFDEIDAGVGGLTLNHMADRLARLAQRRQVLLITHWPQLAVRANRHFQVAKHVEDNETFTTCRALAPAEIPAELARMAGGGAQGAALAKELAGPKN